MPTRMQILLATPRCPGNGGNDCMRPLVWKHDHEAWACTKHGMVLDPVAAAHLDETPA